MQWRNWFSKRLSARGMYNKQPGTFLPPKAHGNISIRDTCSSADDRPTTQLFVCKLYEDRIFQQNMF
jgi:hypothetical protein